MYGGTDCAKALKYRDPHAALKRYCLNSLKRGVQIIQGKKRDGSPVVRMREKIFITEGDLNNLILNSKMPEAERVKKWLAYEVMVSVL